MTLKTAVIAALVVLAVAWLLYPGSTDGRLIVVGPLRRLVRWYRSLWVRGTMAVFGWPHLVDLFFGTGRAPTATTPSEVVWEEGLTRLYRYKGSKRTGEPVLVVHALVSKPWILDLTPERSLVGSLLSKDLDVFLLDWGDPGYTESVCGLPEYIELLEKAEEHVIQLTGARRLHLIGYCMGATLCLVRMAVHPNHERIGSLVAIAPPVDLAVPKGMRRLLGHRFLKPALLLDGSGCVPASLVRESFHVLRPQALKTVWSRFKNRHDPNFCTAYDALARWVWEHRRLPGALFFDLVDISRTNGLFERNLMLDDQTIELSQIKAPVLLAIAESDHIVPSDSSRALAGIPGLKVEVLSCTSGHVSMICGSAARTMLWPKLHTWLGEHQS